MELEDDTIIALIKSTITEIFDRNLKRNDIETTTLIDKTSCELTVYMLGREAELLRQLKLTALTMWGEVGRCKP